MIESSLELADSVEDEDRISTDSGYRTRGGGATYTNFLDTTQNSSTGMKADNEAPVSHVYVSGSAASVGRAGSAPATKESANAKKSASGVKGKRNRTLPDMASMMGCLAVSTSMLTTSRLLKPRIIFIKARIIACGTI